MERVLAPEHSIAEVSDSTPAAPVTRYLERLHSRHANLTDGAVATYIPELARAEPEWFGIALTTVDRVSYEVGDARQAFPSSRSPNQLEDLGEPAVRRRIGVEPTGDAFNSITLAPDSGSPLNPIGSSSSSAAG